jgi:hypothetical protein
MTSTIRIARPRRRPRRSNLATSFLAFVARTTNQSCLTARRASADVARTDNFLPNGSNAAQTVVVVAATDDAVVAGVVVPLLVAAAVDKRTGGIVQVDGYATADAEVVVGTATSSYNEAKGAVNLHERPGPDHREAYVENGASNGIGTSWWRGYELRRHVDGSWPGCFGALAGLSTAGDLGRVNTVG